MSRYLGDYAEDYATLNFKFHTTQSDGTPITLGGTPAVSVYKANGTTESTAGVTLTVDFDSRTGCHNVLIDLSADAFYATANDYQVVITTGTVDGTSVVGYVLATFSIENRYTRGTDGANTTTPPTVGAIADAVCDEVLSGHTTAGTVGKALSDVLADTNELQADWANGGRLDLILDAVPSAAVNASTLLASTADGVAVSEILRQLLALGVGGKFTYDSGTGVLERFAQDGTTSLGSITLTATGGTPV